jgi:mycothiol synthase
MNNSFQKLIEDGYQVRPARIEDLLQAVPMFNLAEIELNGKGEWTIERYEGEWLQNKIDLDASTRIVITPDDKVVGCVELWDLGETPARPWIWARVHPDWKGRGIGTAMLDWALQTSRRAINRLPEDARLAPNVATPAHHKPSIQLFENMGMSACRYTWRMVRSLEDIIPEPNWPEGIHIRNLRYPDDLEAVFLAENDAFQEHWGYIKPKFEEAFPRWKNYNFEAVKLDPQLWFVAWDGENIAGSINAQERSDLDVDMGFIPNLGVRKPYRRHGLGQALLQQAFRALQERGVTQVSLTVDSENKTGATRLYQRVGMRVDREIVHYEIELRPGRELAVMD